MSNLPKGVHLTLSPPKGTEEILSTEAIEFLTVLHRTFDVRRKELLENRKKVQAELDNVCPCMHLDQIQRDRGSLIDTATGQTPLVLERDRGDPKQPRLVMCPSSTRTRGQKVSLTHPG